MPASPQSSGTAGSIVLVEEYGALAVAIGSALKKFAPGYGTRTVRSLDAAEDAIADSKPDLLVIDFDPPQHGALDFFLRMKSAAPSTRIVIIAAAELSRLPAAGSAAGAFQFVDKPFDLATLGVGVEKALRAAAGLRQLAVADLVPLQCLAHATGVLKVDAAEGRSGEIHFTEGQITHAETTDADGSAALAEMLQWRAPRFKQPKRRPRAAKTIEGSWSTVFADALASVGSAAHDLPTQDEEERTTARVGGGKKIVVVDDTEMLLLFVEDSLLAADPTLEIVTASNGSQGVERVAAHTPDLVLLDYSLPDFNGDEVCKRLLANPVTASIPVIMMSGHVPEMAAAAVRFRNIVATVAKPFLSEVLVDITTKALADPAQFAVRPLAAPSPKPQPAAVAPPPVAAPVREEAAPPEAKAPDTEHRSNGHRRAASPAATASDAAPAPPPPNPAPPPPAPSSFEGPSAKAAPAAPTYAAVAPPPPIPMMVPAPVPSLRRAPATAVVAQPKPAPVAAPRPSPVPAATGVAPARIAAVASNAVVVGLALEVVAIQFSATLQMAAIRARPASRMIALHVQPDALPGVTLPEAGFELGPVLLDARGQIDTIRLLPTAQRISAIQPRNAFPVGAVAVLPTNGGKAVELTPTAAAPMTMFLTAPFNLVGVELSQTFGVGALVLKARGGEIRVSLGRDGVPTGASFKTAQVLLNRSAAIAEILLDAVA